MWGTAEDNFQAAAIALAAIICVIIIFIKEKLFKSEGFTKNGRIVKADELSGIATGTSAL